MNAPGLDNVDGHRGGCSHQPADHAGAEVAQDVITEMPWGHPRTSKGNGGERPRIWNFPMADPHPELTRVKQELFGLGVGGELGSVDHHGTGHGGDTALGENGVFG